MFIRDEAMRLLGCFLISAAVHAVAFTFAVPRGYPLDSSVRMASKGISVDWRGEVFPLSERLIMEEAFAVPHLSETVNKQAVRETDGRQDPDAGVASRPRLLSVRELQLDELPESEGGFVDVELLVAPSGSVARVTLLSTNLPREYFDEIKDAFLAARFTAAARNGIPEFAVVRFRTGFGVDPFDASSPARLSAGSD
jgi:hypothetical protein